MDIIENKIVPYGKRVFRFEADAIRVTEQSIGSLKEHLIKYDSLPYSFIPQVESGRQTTIFALIWFILIGIPVSYWALSLIGPKYLIITPIFWTLTIVFSLSNIIRAWRLRRCIDFGTYNMYGATHEELIQIISTNKNRYIARKTDSIYKLQGMDAALAYLAHLEQSDVLSLSEYEKYATEVKNREPKVGFNVREE